MDIKTINTTGWRKPHGKSIEKDTISDEEEIESLRESTYYPNQKNNFNYSNSVTTMEWISTWRKIANS